MRSGPEYLVCLDCESPCYVFEWEDGKILEAVCTICGNDDVEEFLSSEDYDELSDG